MYIKELHIAAFGPICDKTFKFDRGLNIIEGKNEAGKSTLGAFIKFIFYGLDSKERTKYFPWGKNTAGGYIKLSHGGKDYTVRRDLVLLQKGVKEEVTVTDCETGAVAFKDSAPHEVFLGVNEKVFSSTVFVGQINGAYVDGAKLSGSVQVGENSSTNVKVMLSGKVELSKLMLENDLRIELDQLKPGSRMKIQRWAPFTGFEKNAIASSTRIPMTITGLHWMSFLYPM